MSQLVDLMIVGAQKAGTTSLKEYLGQHPAAVAHSQRELTWFVDPEEHGLGPAALSTRYFPGAAPGATWVGKAVGIMFLPEALDRLVGHNPRVRTVAVLRHPVDRAYSAYWYCRRFGWEELSTFEEALDAEASRTAQQTTMWRHTAYVGRGLYAEQLERLHARLGRDQVRVVLVEDLKQDPAAVCRELFRFAGLDPSFQPDFSRRENSAGAARSASLARILSGAGGIRSALKKIIPVSLGAALKRRLRAFNDVPFTPPPMASETRARLLARFEPDNLRLSQLLGRDLSAWNR